MQTTCCQVATVECYRLFHLGDSSTAVAELTEHLKRNFRSNPHRQRQETVEYRRVVFSRQLKTVVDRKIWKRNVHYIEDSFVGSRHQYTPRTPTRQNRRVSLDRFIKKVILRNICEQQPIQFVKFIVLLQAMLFH